MCPHAGRAFLSDLQSPQHSGTLALMWIKICGITRPEDAVATVEAGASAIGLNFFSGSKRCVSIETAQRITRAVRANTEPNSWGRLSACHTLAGQPQAESPAHQIVGVFVNSAPAEVLQTAEAVGLSAIQFHGEESVADIAKVCAGSPHLQLIRALRISRDRRQDCFEHLRDLQSHVKLFAVLLDAFVPGEFGGTGVTIDPQLVVDYSTQDLPRLILAGGLTPDNVAQTISDCHPWGVDTASGVESSPGVKCPEKIRRFMMEAHRASAASR